MGFVSLHVVLLILYDTTLPQAVVGILIVRFSILLSISLSLLLTLVVSSPTPLVQRALETLLSYNSLMIFQAPANYTSLALLYAYPPMALSGPPGRTTPPTLRLSTFSLRIRLGSKRVGPPSARVIPRNTIGIIEIKEFVSHIAGHDPPNNGETPVWEPLLLLHKGELICFYSDQCDPLHGQEMVYQATNNGNSWGPVVNDIRSPRNARRCTVQRWELDYDVRILWRPSR